LKHDDDLKIADLGFAKQLKNVDEMTRTKLGTLITAAPEVFEGKPYGIQAEVFR
jgi:serine/threonine protein kinase